jgi:bacillolysin
MNPARRFAFYILLLSCTIPIASAQKRPGDNRPLSGLDASAIPNYKSVQSYMQAHPNSTVLSAAPVVGATQNLPLSTSMQSIRVLSSLPANSQLKIYRRQNGSIEWLEGTLTPPQQANSPGKQGATAVQRALALLTSHSALLRINKPQEELVVINSSRDDYLYEHVRFQQVYKGIPIWGRDFYVHLDPQGVGYLINGSFEPSPVGIETTPLTRPAAALETVVSDLRYRNRYRPLSKDVASRLGINDPTERLILYPMPQGELRLAYEVKIAPNLVGTSSYIVDAGDGKILNRIERHSAHFRHDASSLPISLATVNSTVPKASSKLVGSWADAYAYDLNGVNQKIRVWKNDSSEYYLIWDLPSFTGWDPDIPNMPKGGGVTLAYNSRGSVVDVVSMDNTWSDPAAISAHFNMMQVYNYFKNTFGRNSLDAIGGRIKSVVHKPYDSTVGPAAWGGANEGVQYSDDTLGLKCPAGALDVVGHELTHGIEESQGAVWADDPSTVNGALKESLADVFGVFIDATGRTNYTHDTDFFLGKNIIKPPTEKVAVRDLANPRNPNAVEQAASNMSEFDSTKGKYYNMGIPNRAACYIIKAVGKNKAEQLYYLTLTKYLTSIESFVSFRHCIQAAAKELLSKNTIDYTDLNSIQLAFNMVGIPNPDAGCLGGARGNEVPPITGGRQYIAFMTSTGQIGLCDPVTGQTTMFTSPDAAARTSAGGHSRLSTGFKGQKIWFINQSGQLANIDVVSGTVNALPQVYVQRPGDLWNASVSPDEAYVSLVSAYSGDPNIYVYNGKQVGKISVGTASTQGGFNLRTFQYPGALSWSCDMNRPMIGFDAYHEISVGATKVGRWGIHEIDFNSTKFYDLIFLQPIKVTIGNITYSNTDPNLMAFTYVDSAGTRDVYVGSFDFGPVSALNIPSFKLGGTSVTDADQPTFSPNDSILCFTSTSRKSLLFLNRFSGQLTALPLQMAVYSPRWFVQGGKVVSSPETEQMPTTFVLHQNFPNPFNPTTRIEYEVPARSQVKLTVYDLLGRLVRTLVNAEMQAGQFSTTWDGTDASGKVLSSGMYVYRLETRDGAGTSLMLSRKMVLLK